MKIVVFDYGGVISYPPKASTLKEIALLGCIDVATLERCSQQLRGEYDRGIFSCEEYYQMLLKLAGLSLESLWPSRVVQMAALDEKAWSHINPDTVRLMEDVKKAGYALGILSNMAQSFLSRIRTEYSSVFSLSDLSIFSCELGLIKPEKAIYKAFLDRLDCNVTEVVFFDDVPINVEKARDMGINAYIWQTAEAARATLRDLGIKV
ncbi:MAG: HAD family phosphatase [Treponema sp.]|jgi:putative hydrolase of the HAD superfamily|nr:HAD family phosphatase [Treponema sp.]